MLNKVKVYKSLSVKFKCKATKPTKHNHYTFDNFHLNPYIKNLNKSPKPNNHKNYTINIIVSHAQS